uniref:ZP domain-containing protein n=1 Tax=Gadus morhua TaxID=8049 RepID=A0A8C5BZE3_GADMO
MRVIAGPLGLNFLEVSVGYNNSIIPVTQRLASQCGISLWNHPGHIELYVSLQNCFAHNVEDRDFTTTLNLRVYGAADEEETYHVSDTCHYPAWASREIICDPDYMEASECRRLLHGGRGHIEGHIWGGLGGGGGQIKAGTLDVEGVTQALGKGYGVTNGPTRLVVRGSPTAPEAYQQDVSEPDSLVWTGVYNDTGGPLITNLGSFAGGFSVTDNTISWFMPRHIDPLISADGFKLLEVHMGVNGQRLDAEEMAARQYTLVINDVHIITKIPVGAIGGYMKSAVKDNEYYTSYTIAPMLELLWAEDMTGEVTRYKVLFSITTPMAHMQPQLIDNTVQGEHLFRVSLGTFAADVVLWNITLSGVVLSVAECNARGFNVQELGSQNGFKTFTLQVPFTDPLVLIQLSLGTTLYSLHLVFGLHVLHDSSPLAYAVDLDSRAVDQVAPVLSGSCAHEVFDIIVNYGTPDFHFQIFLGKRSLTPTLAQQYGLTDHGTHIAFAVPFTDQSAVFEVIEHSHIKSRLDMALRYPETSEVFQAFSVSCSFPSTLTECYPNGTMTAMAVKFESVPTMNLSQLTLNDPTCGPVYTDDRFASFTFSVNSCGTTRKFLSNVLLYENEISLPESMTGVDDPEYELKVKCYYAYNATNSLSFIAAHANNEPYAEPAGGGLEVVIRMASDESYTMFHGPEEYPIPKYLQEPFFFEVELISTNPHVSLELENCWATLTADSSSLPRWNLIINGCPNLLDPNRVVFHPVYTDSRVQIPSHYKRFEGQMFAFAMDQDFLSDQLFVHCDVVLCDANNIMDGPCSGQCPSHGNEIDGMYD